MLRKHLRRVLPSHQSIRDNRYIARFGHRLQHHNLWHLHRRSVAGGIAAGLFAGLIPGSNPVQFTAGRWTGEASVSFKDGKPAVIETLHGKGKVVLFEFWTTWCKYCEEEAQLVDNIAREYKSKNLIVLAVNVLAVHRQARAARPHVESLLLTSSDAGVWGEPSIAGYSATKGAVTAPFVQLRWFGA